MSDEASDSSHSFKLYRRVSYLDFHKLGFFLAFQIRVFLQLTWTVLLSEGEGLHSSDLRGRTSDVHLTPGD